MAQSYFKYIGTSIFHHVIKQVFSVWTYLNIVVLSNFSIDGFQTYIFYCFHLSIESDKFSLKLMGSRTQFMEPFNQWNTREYGWNLVSRDSFLKKNFKSIMFSKIFSIEMHLGKENRAVAPQNSTLYP